MAASRASSPKAQYGSGTVMIWDQGTWTPDFDPAFGYKKGHLKFHLNGKKLKGQWHLVRMKPKPREKNENWLLFKSDDEAARPADAPDILAEKPHSAATGRSIEAIGREHDRVWASGQGEVAAARRRSAGARPAVDAASIAEGEERRRCRASSSPPCRRRPRPRRRAAAGCTRSSTTAIACRRIWRTAGSSCSAGRGSTGPSAFPSSPTRWPRCRPRSRIIDGEVVVQTAAGVASFAMLVDALKSGSGDMLFYAFDLLYLDGYDLREAPLARARRRWPSYWPTPATPAASATATISRATAMRCSGMPAGLAWKASSPSRRRRPIARAE